MKQIMFGVIMYRWLQLLQVMEHSSVVSVACAKERIVLNRPMSTYMQHMVSHSVLAVMLHRVKVTLLGAGPPPPPKAPSLSALNSVTLNISWIAPWSLPVDNYTITMLNFDTADVQSHWTTPQTSFLVTKPHNSDCELFDFTVEASTGVGSTGRSQPGTAGFPSCELSQPLNQCAYKPW